MRGELCIGFATVLSCVCNFFYFGYIVHLKSRLTSTLLLIFVHVWPFTSSPTVFDGHSGWPNQHIQCSTQNCHGTLSHFQVALANVISVGQNKCFRIRVSCYYS